MADEPMPDWEAETADSHAPIQPAVGNWKLMLDPANDPIYQEIEEYCTFRRLCRRYLDFCIPLMRPRPSEREARMSMQIAWDDIHGTIIEFPIPRQLLKSEHQDAGRSVDMQVSYHTSYTIFSDTSTFSRSVMLAQLPDVVKKIQSSFKLFSSTMLTENSETGCKTLYDMVIASFNKWQGMAKSNMNVPFQYMHQREQNGRPFTPRAKLDELLSRLGALHADNAEQPQPDQPDPPYREIEFTETFDRAGIGWTEDVEAQVGPRYIRKTQTLLAYPDESFFDRLLNYASFEHWLSLTGRDNVHPTHVVDWTLNSFITQEATRQLVDEWKQQLFTNGDANKGFFILQHQDIRFGERYVQRRSGKEPEYQPPTRPSRGH